MQTKNSIVQSILLVVCVTLSQPSFSASEANDQGKSVWQKLHSGLLRSCTFENGASDIFDVTLPVRAEDAAVVPISIRAKMPQTADRYIKKIYLIIDNNPSPVAAVFQLTPDVGRADIETRVRIEQYTDVRVIAETNDNKLYMQTRFVKASGGCSAPASKDAAAAAKGLGTMKISLPAKEQMNSPTPVQVMIKHPNDSGLAMDQVTRTYAPPHFVKKLTVSFEGKPILTADIDFSISENPHFRFLVAPKGQEGRLDVVAEDTENGIFKTSTVIGPARH